MASSEAPGESLPAANPCCEKLKRRLDKLIVGRDALHRTITILEGEMKNSMAARDELAAENRRLKLECDEHQHCGKLIVEVKEISFAKKRLEEEVNELRAQLSSLKKEQSAKKEDNEQFLTSELKAEIGRLKIFLATEKERSDSERRKADEQGNRAKEAWNLLKAQKRKMEEERKQAAMEKRAASEARALYDKVQTELQEVRRLLALETKKVEEANKSIILEKKNARKVKKLSEGENSVLVELKGLLEFEKKRASIEKKRADLLFQKLCEEKERSADLQSKLRTSSSYVTGRVLLHHNEADETTSIKLLKEELKLRKKQVKHVKDVMKLEKSKNALASKELFLLKQDLLRLLSRFDMLNTSIFNGTEFDDLGEMKSSELLSCRLGHGQLPGKPAGGSHKMKSQSSGRFFYPAPWTDEVLIGSHEKDCTFISQSAEAGKCFSRGTISNSFPGQAWDHSKKLLLESKNSLQRKNKSSSSSSDDVEKMARCRRKRKRMEDTLEPNVQLDEGNPNKVADEIKVIPNEDNGTKVNGLLQNADAPCMIDEVMGPGVGTLTSMSDHLAGKPWLDRCGSGGILKLFELDNAITEERFRRAMEDPISPLPLDLADFAPSVIADSTSYHLGDHNIKEPEHSSSVVFQDHKRTDLVSSERICKSLSAKSGFISCLASERAIYNLIVFSNMSLGTMERMESYWTKMIQSVLDANVTCASGVLGAMVDEVLHEAELLTDEKVCLIFSSMMSVVCSKLPENCDSLKNTECQLLDSFLNSVEFDWILLETDYLGAFFTLIEAFLIDLKVPMSTSSCCDYLVSSQPKKCYMNVGAVHFTSAADTINQFVAGCIILASTCLKLNKIDQIMYVSYKHLSSCANSYQLSLLALHTYAAVCGDKFFQPNSHFVLLAAFKLVVVTLESGNKSRKGSFGVQTAAYSSVCKFCDRCPFSHDFCEDEFLTSVLDKLQRWSMYEDSHANVDNLTSKSSTPTSEQDDFCVKCADACTFFKYPRYNGNLSGTGLCCFMELISVVELIGIHLCWEWMCNKIVLRLMEMLKSCTDEFSAAVFALVGHLGRFGIEEMGYDNREVSELKETLALIVGNCECKRSLPVQFSAVGALLNLLPVTFKQITHNDESGSTVDPCVHVILKWFRNLSIKEKSLSFAIFG